VAARTSPSTQASPSAATFLTDAELRLAIRSAPEEIAGQSGTYLSLLSPPSESPVLGIRRTTPGRSEWHARFTDVWYVLDGAATLITGGTIEDGVDTGPGEIRGRGISNGSARHLQRGELVVIPAGTPHWISEIDGDEIAYLVVKVPV
jgi:mannose-6-phosphate isomerase-like protein (cupin superfamily)